MVDRPGAAPAGIDVVLISNGFQAEYEIGFANGLARCGVRPLLVCSDNMLRSRLDPGVATINLRGSQRPDRPAWEKALNILRYWLQLHRLLRSQNTRTIHVIGQFTLPSTWAALWEASLLRLSARHFVYTVHNLLPHDAHGSVNRWLYRCIYKLPHTLVVHTPRMRKTLQDQFGVAAHRIVVMEHGIDRLAPPAAGNRHWLHGRLGLPPQKPVVLFFGAVSPYKGLDTLVKALVAAPDALDAILIVAGRCRDAALRRAITPSLTTLVDQGRARWVDGFVSEDEVLHYFQGADVLVMPYRAIDQSGVIFIALATGLPVVATDVGSLADYVPLTGGQLVAQDDISALLAGLRAVLAATTHADRAVRVAVAARFLWSQTVLAVLPAYGGSR